MNARNDTLGSAPLTAFFMGSLIGVTAGLLFAPRTGKESRDMIRHSAREKYNKMQQKAKHAQDSAQANIDDAIDMAQNALDATQQKAEDTNVILDTVKPRHHTNL